MQKSSGLNIADLQSRFSYLTVWEYRNCKQQQSLYSSHLYRLWVCL